MDNSKDYHREGSREYVEVIVDIPTLRLQGGFHYRLPARFRESTSVGSAVLVPFRGRQNLGYVVGFPSEPDVAGLKDVSLVLDDPPLFDWEAHALSRWISSYYQSPLSSALHLVSPPGRTRKLLREIILDSDRDEALDIIPRERSLDSAIVELLDACGGRIGLPRLSEYFSGVGRREIRSSINRLEEAGLVSRHARLEDPRVKAKSQLVVNLTSRADEDGEEGSARPLTENQRRVIEYLERKGGPELKSELMRLTATGSSTIKSLEKRGLVLTEPGEVLRDPRMGRGISHPRHSLTDEQEVAVSTITATSGEEGSSTYLLEGVTGSGKTEVYLRCIESYLDTGRGAIVLVPEISLTPQMLERFHGRFPGKVAVLHSRLSQGERYDQWRSIRDGTRPVVLGARSAVFAPVRDLGLIVLDEEQESAYKSQISPRYHAREVAMRRARSKGADVILGSATPSFESLYLAKAGRYTHLRLTRRVDDRPMPEIDVVDMKKEAGGGRVPLVSTRLLHSLVSTVEGGEQAIVLLNRRGYSNYLQCHTCGHIPRCDDCEVSLCYHRQGDILLCHHCNRAQKTPRHCPACGEPTLRGFGAGTQQVEREMAASLPGVSVVRMDTDTTRGKDSHWLLLDEFRSKRAQVLLGTQMIAKGLDIPNVTLVGVINADTALALPDFRAAERTYRLITQVSGRAGRGTKPGRVVIQTYNPDHPAIAAAVSQDPSSFLEEELDARRGAAYPPFVKLVNILLSSPDSRAVSRASAGMKKILDNRLRSAGASVLGPAPAPLTRIKGNYRWHILLKCPDFDAIRGGLREAVSEFRDYRKRFGRGEKDVTVSVDVDPESLL